MITNEKAIRTLVKTAVESYSEGFEIRHIAEKDDPDGTINMKIHNVFISALGSEIQYYAALVRSLDSSLGNMLEKLAINIAELFYKVSQNVKGPLYPEQTRLIAEILEAYKSRQKTPNISHYQSLRKLKSKRRIYHSA
ncbi:MAG: TdeIII family type II restriction endonuclease [Planctomycetota bacterium]